MTQHSKSLLLSIIIHALFLGGIFYAFHEAISFVGHKKEKKVCIKLGCIHSVQSQRIATKKIEKKVKKHKKVVKKIPKKKPVKKKIKKKTAPKKVIPLKKIKKVPETSKIEKKEEVSREVTVEEEKCPMQEKRTKETNLPKDAQEKSRQTESSQNRYMNMHLAEIAKLLQENLYYPRRARKRGVEGSVIVTFTLLKDATVINSTIVSSSNEVLSRAALKTLKNLSGEFPKPDDVLTLTVPISYSLH